MNFNILLLTYWHNLSGKLRRANHGVANFYKNNLKAFANKIFATQSMEEKWKLDFFFTQHPLTAAQKNINEYQYPAAQDFQK